MLFPSDSSIFLSKRMRKVSRRVRESYYYESPNEELDKAHGENDKDNNDDDDAYDPSVTKPSVQKRLVLKSFVEFFKIELSDKNTNLFYL